MIRKNKVSIAKMNNVGSIAVMPTSLYLAWDVLEKLYGGEYAKSMLAEVRKLFIIEQISGNWINGDVFVMKKTREEAIALFKQLTTYTVRGAPLPIRAMIMSERVYTARAVSIFATQHSPHACLFVVSNAEGARQVWLGEAANLVCLWPDDLEAFIVKSQVDKGASEVMLAREGTTYVKDALSERVIVADMLRKAGYTRVTTLMPVEEAQEIIPGYYGVAPPKLDIVSIIDMAIERFTAKHTVTREEVSFAIFEKIADGN